ncbi:YdbL family protein [uncultured Marinobacter sp.]|uniref:YdbL family protein n=1 Tax=uncultured Marinobacter sp. TaxID=187379 RepID=UPI0026141516|nr:YdbL family protein [uncultured Marinobacter sp.]
MTLFARFSALIVAFCLALPAMAMSLDEAKNALESAKSQGLVGETPAGYLAAVSSNQKARDIVSAINDARREAYKEIAEKHGIAVTKVETVAGQKAVEKTPVGQYILVGERWLKK